MSTIPIDDKLMIGPDRANIDARYKASNNRPYTSVAAAEAAINLVIGNVGLTVLVADENDPDYPKAKEYWVQPKGTTPETYGLVEKGAGVTDYEELENLPHISDGQQGGVDVELKGTLEVSAETASGSTAGVELDTQTAGKIKMKFTLPKGADGQNGITPSINPTTKHWEIAGSDTGVLAEGQDGAPGHNPCLGRFNVLPTLSPNPFADARKGDYIYFDTTDQQTSAPVTYIYYFDGTDWDTTGTLVDVSNLSFSSGESVTDTKIIDAPVNDYGDSVVGGELFEGSNVYEKSLALYGIVSSKGLDESDGSYKDLTLEAYKVATFDIKNAKYVKISGHSPASTSGSAAACFYNEAMEWISSVHDESSQALHDKIVAVPQNARFIKVFQASSDNPASAKGVYFNTLDSKKLSQYSLKDNIAQAISGSLLDGRVNATELLKLRELPEDAYIPSESEIEDLGPKTLWRVRTESSNDFYYVTTAAEFAHACKVEIPDGYSRVVFVDLEFGIPNSLSQAYGFLNSLNQEVSHVVLPGNAASETGLKVYDVEIPAGAKYFCTNCQVYLTPPMLNKDNFFVYFTKAISSLSEYVNGQVCKYRRIVPKWLSGNPIYSTLDTFTFGKGAENVSQLIHTPLLKAVGGTNLVISGLDANKSFHILEYDVNNNKVAKTDHANTTSNVTHVFNKDTAYFVIQGTNLVDGEYMRDLGLELYYLVNDAKLTTFVPRSSNGYQVLAMNVGYNNMASNSYTPNNNLEVEMEYAVDYGMLCLPESYTQEGTPTRLIVFTHGHAVNYDANSTVFNSDDIKPEYWLSEGYAILDMDGSVTGTFSGNHDYEPAAINAYETAYQWVVAHFNIRRDGVFSCGRSMGGGMQFSLIRASSIPIVASAPIVPVTSPLGYVLMAMTGTQRKQLLAAYGVPSSVLDGVTWTSSQTAYKDLTQDEKDVIVAYQWMYAPYSPGYCINRPFTDAELTLWSEGYAGKNEAKFTALTTSIADSINPYGYNNVPVRMYTCVGDPLVTHYSVEWLHKVLCRAGYNAQIHVFPATANPGEFHVSVGDHRFEINSENLVTYTNSKGVTLQNVPKVYIEILAFWRRFENQDSVD